MSESADWRADPAWPDVDVVMPILNEAAHLADALAAIRAQEYTGNIRVIMAVGPSDDGTEAVAAKLVAADPALAIIDNPTGKTPAALNLAIRAGSAPVVVRVDGHSQLSSGYIARAVETLRRTGAANVGGMQVPKPTTPFQDAVATATSSWLGTGGASYRTGGAEGPVDTVYLGVFDRAAIEAVGLFDERLIRNQDYELNIRLRKAGRQVMFDPTLSVGYAPRGTWRALALQYFEYGQWKAVVLRLHPGSLKVRQLVPPIGILGVLTGLVVGRRWPFALVLPLAYSGAIVSVTWRQRIRRARFVVAVLVIHGAWTAGIVSGLLSWRRV